MGNMYDSYRGYGDEGGTNGTILDLLLDEPETWKRTPIGEYERGFRPSPDSACTCLWALEEPQEGGGTIYRCGMDSLFSDKPLVSVSYHGLSHRLEVHRGKATLLLGARDVIDHALPEELPSDMRIGLLAMLQAIERQAKSRD